MICPVDSRIKSVGGEAFGGNLLIAGEDEFANFVPINGAAIEAESHPTARADVCGKIEMVWIRAGESGIVARQSLASNRYDAVSMMVVEEICEGSFSNRECGVGVLGHALGFRECETDFG